MSAPADMDNEKPFKCPKCSQCFATSDHLLVHQRMHASKEKKENHDLIVKIPTTSSDHPSDQTPTPTRFVKIADVEGSVLFEEINPFDQDFKLASKKHSSHDQHNASSSISSTSTVYEVCPSQGITIKSLQKIIGTASKLPKSNSDSESEVSSTVSTEAYSSKASIQKIKSKEGLKECLVIDQDEISSSTSEDRNDHRKTLLDIKKVTSKPEIIKLNSYSSCKQGKASLPTSSCSSTVDEVTVKSTSPLTNPLSNVSILLNTSSIASVYMPSSNVSTLPTSLGKNQTIVSSTNDQKQNNQTSLQSLLQQIRRETGDASVKPGTNSGAQSQEVLREQLKSLIKSGQIKIKFTSDPSSPKVQATIVGNIAKKTPVTSCSTMVHDSVVSRPTMAENISTPRPTMVQDIQPNARRREEFIEKESLSQNSNILHKIPQKTSIIKDKGQVAEKQVSPTLILPQRLQPKFPATIQIIPKHPISKPIPIAPKKVTTAESSNSISIPPKTMVSRLPGSDVATVSTALSPVQSASSLVFAKQKLKHAIQQNACNKTENALVNGRVSMVPTGGSQRKYKDIVLDTYHEGTTDAGTTTTTTTTTTINTTTSYTTINDEHSNKRKLILSDDGSSDEKRKRFLERNRAAASRCRQKRKVWVNQLESKSDDLLQTNTLLMNEINALRSEVVQLKSLLLAHKDCPVTQQQKALLGQMTPGSYIAAVSDGQIIAIHQIPESNGQETKSAEEVASSALTDMAARATMEIKSNVTTNSTNSTTSATSATVQSTVVVSTVCSSLPS